MQSRDAVMCRSPAIRGMTLSVQVTEARGAMPLKQTEEVFLRGRRGRSAQTQINEVQLSLLWIS